MRLKYSYRRYADRGIVHADDAAVIVGYGRYVTVLPAPPRVEGVSFGDGHTSLWIEQNLHTESFRSKRRPNQSSWQAGRWGRSRSARGSMRERLSSHLICARPYCRPQILGSLSADTASNLLSLDTTSNSCQEERWV